MSRSGIIIFAFILLNSCISPYETHTPFQEQVIVQGMITDQPGPYLVKISRTVSIESQLDKTPELSGALVLIQDDEGNSENLIESTPGNYYTTTFQGVIGRSYTLTVTTHEGIVYQSVPEKLSPVGDFTNLRYEFVQNEEPNSNLQISSTNGFNIYLDSDVLPEQEKRVWWRWTGTYEIMTYPQLRTAPVAGRNGVIVLVPNPPPCSGFFRSPDNTLVGPFHDCACCTCWVTQYSSSPIISDFQFVNDGKISDFNIDFIEANRRTFYQKYHLQVDQMSVSEAVYDFWKAVKTQDENGTNLFQTPPPRTSGNIKAVTENAPPVIGYFAASAVKSHDLVIDRSAVPYPLREIDTLVSECTGAFKNSSTGRPAFW